MPETDPKPIAGWGVQPDTAPAELTAAMPSVLMVMGVSGSGKSTIGTQLAIQLQWSFEDGDWFHPASNVEKMHSGQPLTDEDRRPWLKAIADFVDATRRDGNHVVIACSALKRSYRAIIIGNRPDVRLIYLKGDVDLIGRRIAARQEHFMPLELLKSQFDALEEPGPDENPIVVSVQPPPRAIVTQVLSALMEQRRESDAASRR